MSRKVMARTIDPMLRRVRKVPRCDCLCVCPRRRPALPARRRLCCGGPRCSRIAPNTRCAWARRSMRRASARPCRIFSSDCAGWHLKRDIKTEIALTTSWRMSLASKLDADEQRGGNALPLPHAAEPERQRARDSADACSAPAARLRAEIVSPNSPPASVRAAAAHPDAGRRDRPHDRAAAGRRRRLSRPDVRRRSDRRCLPGRCHPARSRRRCAAARPADRAGGRSAGKSWPVFMTFTRGREQQQRPLFTVSTQVFDNRACSTI